MDYDIKTVSYFCMAAKQKKLKEFNKHFDLKLFY